MKKFLVAASMLVCALGFALNGFADDAKGKMDLKVGDEAYICQCGEKCPCDTISLKEGTCSCKKPLIKAKVNKVEGGMVYFEGQSKGFKSTGKYCCTCDKACQCETISQKAGKCGCGKVMKKCDMGSKKK